jgi:hypothetical protein
VLGVILVHSVPARISLHITRARQEENCLKKEEEREVYKFFENLKIYRREAEKL